MVFVNLIKNLSLLYFLIYFLFLRESFFYFNILNLIKYFFILTLLFLIYFNFYNKFFKIIYIEKTKLQNLVFCLRPLKFLKKISKLKKDKNYIHSFEPFHYMNRIFLDKVFCEKEKDVINSYLLHFFFLGNRYKNIIGSELIRYFYANYFYFNCYYIFLVSNNFKINLIYSLTKSRTRRFIKKKNEL